MEEGSGHCGCWALYACYLSGLGRGRRDRVRYGKYLYRLYSLLGVCRYLVCEGVLYLLLIDIMDMMPSLGRIRRIRRILRLRAL